MSVRRYLPVLSFVVALALVLGPVGTSAAGSDRVVIDRTVGLSGHDFVGYCGTGDDRFTVYSDYSYTFTLRIHKDKDGNIVRVAQVYKVLGKSVYYADPSTGITLVGGPGEVAKYTWDAERNLLYFSGVSFKVILPGGGVIFMQSGHYVYDLSTGLIISQSGHNDLNAGNLESLCAALTTP